MSDNINQLQQATNRQKFISTFLNQFTKQQKIWNVCCDNLIISILQV